MRMIAMKQYLIPILITLMLTSGLVVGCASTWPKEENKPNTEGISAEQWDTVNEYLDKLYGLPSVKTTEELRAAAFLVDGFWSEKVDEATTRLEQQNIPWGRTPPFCYLFNWYVLHDIQLTNVSSPIEFMAADHLLADSVKALHDEAEELVHMKWLGEPLNSFPTEEDAMESFKEVDKDWERMMEEAISKGKQKHDSSP